MQDKYSSGEQCMRKKPHQITMVWLPKCQVAVQIINVTTKTNLLNSLLEKHWRQKHVNPLTYRLHSSNVSTLKYT